MKKVLTMVLGMLVVLCSFCALAETDWTALERLTVGEDGLVRDLSGTVVGATPAHGEWVERMHAQGITTTLVSYRPLTVRDGIVYEDRTGNAIGFAADYVGRLGDSPVSTAVICVLAAASLAGVLGARKKRLAACR